MTHDFPVCSVTQMVVDEVCVVRATDSSLCVNQDVLFLGTCKSKERICLGLKKKYATHNDHDSHLRVYSLNHALYLFLTRFS